MKQTNPTKNETTTTPQNKKKKIKPRYMIQLLTTCWPLPDPILRPPLWTVLLGNCPSLYTGYDVLWCGVSLWPFQVTCTQYDPSQLLLCTYSLSEHKTLSKSLTKDKHYIGTKTSACYQCYCHTEFKTRHWTSYGEESNYPSWNQDNLLDFLLRKEESFLRTADGCWGTTA